MQSKLTTVPEYLASLPPDRREAIAAVRKVILANLDPLYSEGMQYGMIGYAVPHSVFPAGYHCDPKQPLPFAALASQKNSMSLYLMGLYCGCSDPSTNGPAGTLTPHAQWFHQAWAKTGKKLDMGKACIRFKKLEDLPLEVIAEAIRRVPAKVYIEHYLAARAAQTTKGASSPAKPKQPASVTKKKAAQKTPATRQVTKKSSSKLRPR